MGSGGVLEGSEGVLEGSKGYWRRLRGTGGQ